MSFHPTLTDTDYSLVLSEVSAMKKAKVLGSAASRMIRHRKADTDQLFLIHRLRFLLPLPGIDPPGRVDVYDFDDSLFVGSTMDENRRFAWLKRESERWQSYTKRATLVLAGNSYLADHAREHNKRVEVVPSCVDPSEQSLRNHEERGTVKIGWIGSKSTATYLERLLPVFEKLSRRGHKFELSVVGAGKAIQVPWATSVAWTLEGEKKILSSFDIGIMPLPDDPWTRGKCGYKLLQYFAAGVPAVASPVGVNRDLVGNDRGILARSEAEWLSALEQLMLDWESRKEMGANARQFVEREYSYQRWAPRLADLLRSV